MWTRQPLLFYYNFLIKPNALKIENFILPLIVYCSLMLKELIYVYIVIITLKLFHRSQYYFTQSCILN